MEFQAFHSSHLTRSQLHQSIILDIIVLSFAFIHCILSFSAGAGAVALPLSPASTLCASKTPSFIFFFIRSFNGAQFCAQQHIHAHSFAMAQFSIHGKFHRVSVNVFRRTLQIQQFQMCALKRCSLI